MTLSGVAGRLGPVLLGVRATQGGLPHPDICPSDLRSSWVLVIGALS